MERRKPDTAIHTPEPPSDLHGRLSLSQQSSIQEKKSLQNEKILQLSFLTIVYLING